MAAGGPDVREAAGDGPDLTVVVVGAGGIGSRHLQALSRLGPRTRVVAVDPSPAARELARARVEADGGAARLRFQPTMDGLPAEVDVAVVATGAAPRRRVVEDLLSRARVRHLVLEKFLFQSVRDHDEVTRLLAGAGVPTWVNLPRRAWRSYRALAARAPSGPLTVQADAPGALGIGTSAVHLVDLLLFLSGESAIELHGHDLQPAASRHHGARELTGTVEGSTPGGSRLRYCASATTTAPLLISLTWPRARAVIDEGQQRLLWSAEDTGWTWSQHPLEVELQSRLTDRVALDLVTGGRCGLPTLAEAVPAHLAVLDAVSVALTGERGPDVVVPIT